MKSNLRWLAVLPMAIVAALLVMFLLHLVIFQTFHKSMDEDFLIRLPKADCENMERFLQPCVSAIAFVYFGARTSPKAHVKTGAILCCIWLLGAFVASLVVANIITISSNVQFQPTYIRISFGAIGSLLGLLIVRHKSSESEP